MKTEDIKKLIGLGIIEEEKGNELIKELETVESYPILKTLYNDYIKANTFEPKEVSKKETTRRGKELAQFFTYISLFDIYIDGFRVIKVEEEVEEEKKDK